MESAITEYDSELTKPEATARGYNDTAHSIYRYLAYRDIPKLISKYVSGKTALDYGAGTGISTQFLINQEFSVTGIDESNEMLEEARINYGIGNLHLVKNGLIPFPQDTFDLVFSSFVLFELGTRVEITNYLKEAYRVLKNTGIFIGVTGNEEMYSRNWLCFETDFPENRNLVSGCKAKIFLPNENIEFTDFYWTLTDYEQFFKDANLEIIEMNFPLGKSDEPYPWKDERTHSPYVIFVARIKSFRS